MLRFKKTTQTVPTAVTRDGKTHTVNRSVSKLIPVAPRNWDVLGLQAAAGIVLALTLVAIVWSTVSIGELLKGGTGYAAAALFDAAWITCIILEVLARYDRDKRKSARRMGAGLVVLTSGAIFWHGLEADSIPLAVVGALVSIVAKVLWVAVLKHIDRDLDAEDAAWLEAETSKATLTVARAQVQRQVARAEASVLGELLAIEHQHRATADALGMSREEFQELRVRALGAVEPAPLTAVAAVGKPTDSTDQTESTDHTEISIARAHAGTDGQNTGTSNPQVTTGAVPALALVKSVPLTLGKSPQDLGKPQPAPAATAPARVAPAASGLARTAAATAVPVGTIAEAVRQAVALGITDTEAIAAKVRDLMPTEPNRYSVRREITRQRPAIEAARASQDHIAGTGQYL
ncbi:DUF2637 domain-containing protein [Streptomyces uncialis]|uniref:DUF2637 domain-containing protein n=1 Tax=Streptomyces uncialis TaxID=1048205 RepID=UPI002255C4A8|nr:DUF2637 domain-containing protein [Streptomyces uncialis]MCX4665059.1 DUF2637 domain-containing protein [Streptomyces uncialis]